MVVIESVNSSLIYLKGFLEPVQMTLLIEITSSGCISGIDLLNPRSDQIR